MPQKAIARPSISDFAVQSKTGKKWDHWFSVLDALGDKKSHTERAKHLSGKHKLSGWWSQCVAVEYEKSRGLRVPLQKCDGKFQVSVSRVISAPIKKAFEAWSTEKGMNAWFSSKTKQDFREGGRYQNGDGDSGEFRVIVPNNRVRFTWEQKQHKPGSWVEVRFTRKDAGRCQVVIQHVDLSSEAEAKDLKEGWSWAIDSLKSFLEKGKSVRFEDRKAAKAKA
jgi:uncharacterized protein YndB with AHSA1/START domain